MSKKLVDLTDEELKQYCNLKSYNTKMAYHVFRLLDEMQQILTEQDIDLTRNSSECKLMKTGSWGDFERFEREFQKRIDYVDDLARKSSLPPEPQNASLRKLLQELIEEYHGSNDNKINRQQFEFISTKDVKDMFESLQKDVNYISTCYKKQFENDGK